MATLTTSHETASTSLVLHSFANLVGPNKLQDRLERVRKKLKNRPFMSPAAAERYAIPLGLQKLYGKRVNSPLASADVNDPQVYQALSFAATTLEFARHMSGPAKKTLIGRTLSALDPSIDARGLAHEYRVAIALANK